MKPKSNISVIVATRHASDYLKLCIETMNKYSKLDNELIIVADLPSWQTLKYLQENNLPYILTNFGHQCMAWNVATQYATRDYLLITSDDMVFGTDWDIALNEITKPNVVGCLNQYNPDLDNCRYNFGYDGNIKNFNFNEFFNYGEQNRKDECVDNLAGPLMYNKEMYWKYGGLTFHSARGHGHDLQLAYRIIVGERGKVLKSKKSFIYHFGPTGKRDECSNSLLSAEHGNDGIKICAGCLKSEKGFGWNENQPESIEINRRGYWLCEKCKNSGNVNIIKLPPLLI